MSKINKIFGREIIDSRGNPTIEAEVHLKNGNISIASSPSGASKGINEAVELRDNDKGRFFGKGVLNSVHFINNDISNNLMNKDVLEQRVIDKLLIDLDGTSNKSKLGANTILAVSLAIAKSAAKFKNIPLYEYIAELNGTPGKFLMPVPMINIINGGQHSNNNIDIQEFMIIPSFSQSFKESIRIGCEIFHSLGQLLKSRNYSIAVGDEGGYSPLLKSNDLVLSAIQESVEMSGYIFGQDIKIAIDCAATSFFNVSTKLYNLKSEKKEFNSKEFTHYLEKLSKRFNIVSIEDGLSENDWDGFIYHTKILGKNIQIVGDDLFVTNPVLLKKGIKQNVANAILIKLNQIGTLTETLETINLAKSHGYKTIISHRSGETEDTFIADLAVGTRSGQIKMGSMSRTDRLAKYNRLIRIEEKI